MAFVPNSGSEYTYPADPVALDDRLAELTNYTSPALNVVSECRAEVHQYLRLCKDDPRARYSDAEGIIADLLATLDQAIEDAESDIRRRREWIEEGIS